MFSEWKEFQVRIYIQDKRKALKFIFSLPILMSLNYVNFSFAFSFADRLSFTDDRPIHCSHLTFGKAQVLQAMTRIPMGQ